MSLHETSRSTGSLLLLSATWAMGGFLVATSIIEPLLALRNGAGEATLQLPPTDRGHADEQARLVIIREAIAAFHENSGRYPANLDELVTGRWLSASQLQAPQRIGAPYYGRSANGYTLLPWRH